MTACKTTKEPIMTPEEERFMTLEGLVQWTEAVITQAQRIAATIDQHRNMDLMRNPIQSATMRRRTIHATHRECHFFAVAAHKLIEHRRRARELGLCQSVDFTEIDSLRAGDIRDLRNMREHVIDYFKGGGRDKDRWMVETPEFKADASSLTGTIIGGRLDYAKFSAAAERLLPALLAEPFPSHPLKLKP
jgi:hypothetical protein